MKNLFHRINQINHSAENSLTWTLIVDAAKVFTGLTILRGLWAVMSRTMSILAVAGILWGSQLPSHAQATNRYTYWEGILYIGIALVTEIGCLEIVDFERIDSSQNISNRLYWINQVQTNAWAGVAGIGGAPPEWGGVVIGQIGTNLPGVGFWCSTNLIGWHLIWTWEDLAGGVTNSEAHTNCLPYLSPTPTQLFFTLGSADSNQPPNFTSPVVQLSAIPQAQNMGQTLQRKVTYAVPPPDPRRFLSGLTNRSAMRTPQAVK